MPEHADVAEMWMLIVSTEDTGHDDTWPLQDVVMATPAEIEELKAAVAQTTGVGLTAYPAKASPLAKWREENPWVVGDDSGDA
jgi:hypothetical protein